MTCAARVSRWVCLCTILVLSISLVHAAEPSPRRVVVAAMPVEPVAVDPALAMQATAEAQAALRQIREVSLVDPAQVDAVLRDREALSTVCLDTHCAQIVGKELGVRNVVMGTLVRDGSLGLRLSLSLVDAERGTVIRTVSIVYEGSFAPLAATGIPVLVRRVLGQDAADPPGMTVVVEQNTVRPLAPPDPPADPLRMPRNGFAVWTGWMNYSGVAAVKGMGDVVYSGDGLPTLGVEYQWRLRSPYTVALFYENGVGGVSGKLKSIYSQSDMSLGGLEVRQWRGNGYLGANLAAQQTCLRSSKTGANATDALCFFGGSVGVAGGYQWPSGWFVSGSLQYSQPDHTEPHGDPNVPQVRSATEYDGWVNVGYRWGVK